MHWLTPPSRAAVRNKNRNCSVVSLFVFYQVESEREPCIDVHHTEGREQPCCAILGVLHQF